MSENFGGTWESCYQQMCEAKTLGFVCKETNGGRSIRMWKFQEQEILFLENRTKADACKNLNSNAEVRVTMTAPLVQG